MARTVAIRALAALLALGVAAAVLAARGAQSDCESARNRLFLERTNPRADLRPFTRAVVDNCDGTETLTTAAAALLRSRRPADAAYLARAAVRREPEVYTPWAALAASTSDPQTAARARRRALELNPLAGGGSRP